MIGYLKYLVDRYNKFKAWDCERTGDRMSHALIYVAYKRDMKYDLKHTPKDLFDAAVGYLHRRIANTRLGRMRTGQKLFSSFDGFDKSGTSTQDDL